MDILLDKDAHDIVFVNGGCPVTDTIRLSVAQRLKILLQTFLGEWFLNTETGVPYFDGVFGKVQSKNSVDLIFQQKILSDPGVIEITNFTSSLDSSRRTYSMSFTVRTSEGVTDEISLNLGV